MMRLVEVVARGVELAAEAAVVADARIGIL